MKIAIIGGGASGVVAAIHASNKENEVTIFERNDTLLKKLLMTGNGRCNYWNEDQDFCHYHSEEELFLKEVIEEQKEKVQTFFMKLGIVPRIKNGYYYPFSNQATSIKSALLKELKRKNVLIKTNYFVEKLEKINGKFYINDSLLFDKVILATGGASYPKTGSDGIGFFLAKSLGHTVIKPYPSLVQLSGDYPFYKEWNGVRSEVLVSLYEDGIFVKEETGEVLFTDYGLSGICIFNLSRYVGKGIEEGKHYTVKMNFLPFVSKSESLHWLYHQISFLKEKAVEEFLEGFLNYKLIPGILKQSKIKPNMLVEDLSNERKEKLFQVLTEFEVSITGTLDFNNAQVTRGGVTLSEVTKKLESKLVKNLYFTGELLDVDGDCGGYNLGFAWMSGILVGESVKDDKDSINKM